MEVSDSGEVELAGAAGELADVGDPAQVGSLGGEVALQPWRRGGDSPGARPGEADPGILGAPVAAAESCGGSCGWP